MKFKRIFIVSISLSIAFGCTNTFDTESYTETIVVLTFDDAHKSIYKTAYPIMREFGFRATNYVNTAVIDTEDRLSLDELHILEEEGGWETGGHTMNHVNLTQVSIEAAHEEIAGGWQFLKDNDLQHNTFALPSGHANEGVTDIIKKYFNSIRGSEDFKMKWPVDRYSLGYYDARNTDGSEKIIGRILSGIVNHECVVIIGFHLVVRDKAIHSRAVTPGEFRDILEFLQNRKLKVLTVSEMLDEL